MRSPQRVLLVAYEFPPRIGVAPSRMTLLVRELSRRGAAVTVLTRWSGRSGAEMEWPGPGRVRVLRVPAVNAPVYRLLDRGHRRLAIALDSLLPVDFTAPWMAAATPLAISTALGWRPNVVIASAPPNACGMVGLAAARAAGLPLVFDLRDPWVRHYLPRPAYEGPLGALHERHALRTERALIGRATVTFLPIQAMWDDYVARYPEDAARMALLRNGWRRDELGDARSWTESARGERPMNWLFAGRAYPGAGYSPEPILDALAGLVAGERLGAGALRIRLLTERASWIDGWFDRHPEMRELVSVEGLRPRVELVRAYREADVMILGASEYPAVPGKAYEYMGCGKPIVASVPEGELMRVVGPTGLLLAAPPGDARRLRTVVSEVWGRWREGARLVTPDWAEIDAFAAESQMERAVDRIFAAVPGLGRGPVAGGGN